MKKKKKRRVQTLRNLSWWKNVKCTIVTQVVFIPELWLFFAENQKKKGGRKYIAVESKG